MIAPLIVPGPGLRDAYSRRADSWPRHLAKSRGRKRLRTTANRDRNRRRLHEAQQARHDRSVYTSAG